MEEAYMPQLCLGASMFYCLICISEGVCTAMSSSPSYIRLDQSLHEIYVNRW